MNGLNVILMLATAFVAVYLESSCALARNWLGAQIDLLPALVACAGLSQGLWSVALVSLLGGLWFDALSANPLGISIGPLFVTGLAIFYKRDLILRDLVFAQAVVGFLAGALVPLLTVVLLLSAGHRPLIGWGSLWQWLVMAAGGAACTPLFHLLFHRLRPLFNYQSLPESTFHHNRELKRGRN